MKPFSATSRFFRLGLVLLVSLSAGAVQAQEMTTGRVVESDDSVQQSLSGALQTAIDSLTTAIGRTCAVGGNTYSHGQNWSESCPAGTQGTVTKTCIHGQVAVRGSTCQAAAACGAQAHGSTWSAADCGAPLIGNNTYKCINGEAVITGSTCQASHQCLNGSTYSSSCPAGMSGSIYYQCNNNTLYQTASYCTQNYNSCGGYPHGSGYSYACANWGTNLQGNVYYQCLDGAWGITSMGCTSSISVSSSGCPYGYTGGYLNFTYNGTTYSNGGCNMIRDGYWIPNYFYGCVNGNGLFICYQNYTCYSPIHGYNNAACASGNPSGGICNTAGDYSAYGGGPLCAGSFSY